LKALLSVAAIGPARAAASRSPAAGAASPPRATHARAADAWNTGQAAPTAASSETLVVDAYGIDERVRAQGRGDGHFFPAADVVAVAQNEEGLAALLVLHDFIRRQVDGIGEDCGVRAAPAGATRAAGTSGPCTAPALHPVAFEQVQRGVQFLRRRCQVLQEFHFVAVLDEKRLVLAGTQHMLQEGSAGPALLFQHVRFARRRIDEQSHGERQIALPREVANDLRAAVLAEREIFLDQVLDDAAILVADGDEDIDDLHAGRKRRRRRLG